MGRTSSGPQGRDAGGGYRVIRCMVQHIPLAVGARVCAAVAVAPPWSLRPYSAGVGGPSLAQGGWLRPPSCSRSPRTVSGVTTQNYGSITWCRGEVVLARISALA